MTVSDVRQALTSDAFPGTRRFWWVVAELLSVVHEAIEVAAYHVDHLATLAMCKSEQFDGSESA